MQPEVNAGARKGGRIRGANGLILGESINDDGGKSWEVNWIATDMRVGEDAAGTAR